MKKLPKKYDFSPKEKDGHNKGKMSRELHNVESYIKQGKSPKEFTNQI